MDMQKGNTPAQLHLRRFGKKVIFCHRIAPALGATSEPEAKTSWCKTIKSFRFTKKRLIILISAFMVVGISITASLLYQQKSLADQKAAAVAEQARVEKVNAAAQECYKKKLEEKSSMLGKITYDQLYDGDACLEQQ